MNQPGTPGFSVSRRALLRAGVGTAMGAMMPPFLGADTASLLAGVGTHDGTGLGGDVINLRVRSRSGRVAFATQRVTVLPAASVLWLAQQLSWRARGLDIPTALPAIRALTPERARAFYSALVWSYTGTALVAGTAWHAAMAGALDAHTAGFIHPTPNGRSDTPTRPEDGLYPFTINEALNRAAEQGWKWKGGKPDAKAESLRKRLEDAAARGALPGGRTFGEAAGVTPVINFWRGEVSLFGASDAQGLLEGLGGGGPPTGMVDVSPADASDKIVTGTLGVGTVIATIAMASNPIGWGAAVGLGLIVLGSGYSLGSGLGELLNERDKGKEPPPNPGTQTGGTGNIPVGGDDTPQNAQNSPHVRLPTNGQLTNLLLNDFRYRHVGGDGAPGDVSKGQSVVLGARQAFDRVTHTMGWEIVWRESTAGQRAKESDETGQLWRDWLRDTLRASYVPDPNSGPAAGNGLDVLGKKPSIPPRAGNGLDVLGKKPSIPPRAGNGLDVLGKKPSIPPRAVALAYDVQGPVLSAGAHDLTVESTVVR